MIIKILMVDDHPSQIEGYKGILAYNHSGHEIVAISAYNSRSAYEIITNPVNSSAFDVVFLDRSLPPFPEKEIHSGEDLALLSKKHMPNSKIVILTSHAEAFMLYNIIQKIHPSGLLVKSDFSADDLLNAFESIMDGKIYYSETVKESIKELLSTEDYLDAVNRQIITLLSQGVKTKSLPEMLSLSQSAIEKRKAHIKDYLCIGKGTDEDILREAKKRGFI